MFEGLGRILLSLLGSRLGFLCWEEEQPRLARLGAWVVFDDTCFTPLNLFCQDAFFFLLAKGEIVETELAAMLVQKEWRCCKCSTSRGSSGHRSCRKMGVVRGGGGRCGHGSGGGGC